MREIQIYEKENLFFLIFVLLQVLSFNCFRTPNKEESAPVIVEQIKKTYLIDSIYVDNTFDGARLNEFSKVNDSTYQVRITPENIPVNNSPWFAFRIWSARDTNINLSISYTDDFTNRYVPKISNDGKTWAPLDKAYFEADTASGSINLRLALTSDKLWIAAQEVISTKHISAWVDSLEKLKFIKKEVVGKSVLNQSINALVIDEGVSDQAVVLIGRQHPPEVPGGTLALWSFLEEILDTTAVASNFRQQFKILVFPLLNPDGVDLGHWRHNANGVDLNRDWVAFSQPETKAVRDWLLNQKLQFPKQKFSFGIDFHTSYSGPYLLTLDTLPHEVAPRITSAWIKRIEQFTGDTLDIRPRAQSLPYCYNWLINELSAEAVTYEEGDEIHRDTVRRRAKIYANTLMSSLLDK